MAVETKDKVVTISSVIDASMKEHLKALSSSGVGTIVRDITLNVCEQFTKYSKAGQAAEQRYTELTEGLIAFRGSKRVAAQAANAEQRRALKEEKELEEPKKAKDARAEDAEHLRSDPLMQIMNKINRDKRLARELSAPIKRNSRGHN